MVTRFRNYQDGWCLDYYAARKEGDDNDVYATGCNSGDFQKWCWNNTPRTATPMRQEQSDLCLTLWPNGSRYSVYMRRCDFQTFGYMQRWYVAFPADGGPAFIRNAAHTNLCLSLPTYIDSTIFIYTCTNGHPEMRWNDW
ncbi:ricin-type beta-trefoil lectin domain protein [Streptomyces sp. V1I1]|uniref:RICIN domain-containing protein n=1 Tax=Streptomyces sp. V1I1 TaxID=3042272 RepID=UPI0027D82DDF|nr:ricin-type beta-trefoil lectin domain protein [Streptomyces sp. V1I1]